MLTTLGWIMLAFGISLLTAALVMPGIQGLQCFIAGALIGAGASFVSWNVK